MRCDFAERSWPSTQRRKGRCVRMRPAPRRGSKAVMHRIANPCRSVRLRPAPPVNEAPWHQRVTGLFCFHAWTRTVAWRQPPRIHCAAGPGGEIGRRIGLKIRRSPKGGVPVRVRSGAPSRHAATPVHTGRPTASASSSTVHENGSQAAAMERSFCGSPVVRSRGVEAFE